MAERAKKMGSDFFGNVSWGTHVCQFYQTKKDLIDVVVPYFKAGLEKNEFCMWITGKILDRNEIIRTMRRKLPQFEHFLLLGQIEIIPYTKWYLIDDVFDQNRVLNAWMDKLEQALVKGYEGMRVTGDIAPLIEGNWMNLIDYGAKLNDKIGKKRMIGMCTYPLVKCGASEVLCAIHTHQFILSKQVGKWESFKISVSGKSKNGMQPLTYTTDNYSCSYTVDSDKSPALDNTSIQPSSNSNTIVISGYKSCTRDIVAQNGLDCFCVDLELDPVDFEIVDFACTDMGRLSKKILREALLGYKVEEGVENAIERVKKRLFFPSKNAIIAALKDVNRWYKEMKEEKKGLFQ